MNKQEIETAIEDLKCIRACYSGYPTQNALDLAISALQQQLTNGWIPVSERLPEENIYSIYVTAKHKESENVFSAKMKWIYGKFVWSNGKEIADKYEVLAWKHEYMPKPYKEASK